MNYEEYTNLLKSRYTSNESIEELQAIQFYEEKFQLKWIATKLKQFSFIGYADSIDATRIENFSKDCAAYALNHYNGLVRGMQNGVVSFAVLASDNVSEEAIKAIQNAPKKHWAAFEMPVIADLKNEKLYFLLKTPIWGAIYYKHFREYITQNFSF